jgi:hypothetical protein
MDDRDARQLFRGLPSGALRGRRLEYDPVSDTLVLSVVPEGKGALAQLYLRTPSREASYVPVVELLGTVIKRTQGHEVVLKSWIVTGSSLFCVVGEAAEFGTHERVRPINERGLVTVDLVSRTCQLWETAQIAGEECFVTELVGAKSSGDELYAIVGFPSKGRLGPVQYCVARLHIRERSLQRVFALEDIFF